jgi:L-lactate dehydrogenase complex protein LldG
MSKRARDKIFGRLKSAVTDGIPDNQEVDYISIQTFSQNEKIEKLKGHMEAVRTEVHVVDAANWRDPLETILKPRALKTELVTYEGSVEMFKEDLFQVDAAITSTVGGISETGAIIIWPDNKEPRLMSLVPPIHIAVLEADKIYNTFGEVMQAQKWPEQMPTNAVLISGPSKTADIELILAFGVHGPKELIVLILS